MAKGHHTLDRKITPIEINKTSIWHEGFCYRVVLEYGPLLEQVMACVQGGITQFRLVIYTILKTHFTISTLLLAIKLCVQQNNVPMTPIPPYTSPPPPPPPPHHHHPH